MDRWAEFVRRGRVVQFAVAATLVSWAISQTAMGQEQAAAPAAPAVTLESVNAKAGEAALAGHNAWMLTSSALVLFMTAPGLAMFYGGLVRKKNVLSVIMQCMFLMALNTVIWGIYGYSLSFGGTMRQNSAANKIRTLGTAIIFSCENVERTWDEATESPVAHVWQRSEFRVITHMLFQGMFFIITPALICGAFAERMKFSAMVAVHDPVGHDRVLSAGPLGVGRRHLGVRRSRAHGPAARSILPAAPWCTSARDVSALICALLIGKRLGFGQEDMRPHNLTYTALGAAMLWVGWFGFNAGSELASDGIAASAFCATHFAAAAGGLAWAAYDWIMRGKPTVLGTASGVVAGLVCITPASGYVQPMPAIIMGAAAGVVCAFACSKIKAAFGYDDALDAFGVHGVGGTLGALLTGVFATRAVSNLADGKPLGLLKRVGPAA